MHIGVFISGALPAVGGGYTFEWDVLRAFVAAAAKRSDHFTLLCRGRATYESTVALGLPSNCQAEYVPRRSYWGFGVNVLTGTVPLSRRYVGRWGTVSRIVRRRQIELLWYVAGGGWEVLDVPYIATVWDVQHRTHPWLPEASSDGEWETREYGLRIFLQRATRIVTGTEIGAAELGFYYQIPRERILLLPHPTPGFALTPDACGGVNVRDKFRLNADYFIYPAQFWPHKSHVILLHALVELRRTYNYRPIMVFSGSDQGNRTFVLEQAETLGVADQVVITDFVPVSDLVSLYRGASGLVYVSMSGPENLPPLEAFALNVPVIASDIAGAEEQLGDAALRVPPCNPSEIAREIYRLKSDDALRQRLVIAGRQRAEAWTAREFVSGMFTFFDEFAPIRRCWR